MRVRKELIDTIERQKIEYQLKLFSSQTEMEKKDGFTVIKRGYAH
jgi:hypothetical protein